VAKDDIEACQRCGRPFEVDEIASGIPTAREKEPISCPYCGHTIERTTQGVWRSHKLSPADEAAWLAEHSGDPAGRAGPPQSMAEVNKDLSITPRNPTDAEHYPELYSLWQKISGRLESGRLDDAEFRAWDAKVEALLRPDELARFHKPLRPHIPIAPDTIQYARNFHLTKILWARQGVERFMSDTGY